MKRAEPPECAGIILAGGRSVRMGTDKALLEMHGETLLARTVRIVSAIASSVVVVGRTGLPPDVRGVNAVPDDVPNAGPLGGIATGLRLIGEEYALVVSCDLPFLTVEMLRLLLQNAAGCDAVVPVWGGRLQPTCALYRRSCCPVFTALIEAGELRVRSALDGMRLCRLGPAELAAAGCGGLTLSNANTPDEWRAVLASSSPWE